MAGWEYEDHPNRDSVTQKCADLQKRLAACAQARRYALADTRPAHLEVFLDVAPQGQEHYAGSYRGAAYPYLKGYRVRIANIEGTQPHQVAAEMQHFHSRLNQDLLRMQEIGQNTEISEQHKVATLARMLSHYVVVFLTVHPYANGNGHISRLIAWALFCVYGFQVHRWDLDKRPKHPFDHCIAQYQAGYKDAMARYFYELLTEP